MMKMMKMMKIMKAIIEILLERERTCQCHFPQKSTDADWVGVKRRDLKSGVEWRRECLHSDHSYSSSYGYYYYCCYYYYLGECRYNQKYLSYLYDRYYYCYCYWWCKYMCMELYVHSKKRLREWELSLMKKMIMMVVAET